MLEPGLGRVLGTTITPSEITTLHTMINLFIVTHITSHGHTTEKLNINRIENTLYTCTFSQSF